MSCHGALAGRADPVNFAYITVVKKSKIIVYITVQFVGYDIKIIYCSHMIIFFKEDVLPDRSRIMSV